MLGELQILPHICTFSSVLVSFVCFSVFCLLFHVLYMFHCYYLGAYGSLLAS